MVVCLNRSILKATDDGTKITVASGDTKLFNVNKTTGDMGLTGAPQSDQTL